MDNRQTLSIFAHGANIHRPSLLGSTITSIGDDHDLETNGLNDLPEIDLQRRRSSRVSIHSKKNNNIADELLSLAELSSFFT